MRVRLSEHSSQPSASIAIRITAGSYGHTAGISLLGKRISLLCLFETRGSDCLTTPLSWSTSLFAALCDPPLNYCLSWQVFLSFSFSFSFPFPFSFFFFFFKKKKKFEWESLEIIILYNSVISNYYYYYFFTVFPPRIQCRASWATSPGSF